MSWVIYEVSYLAGWPLYTEGPAVEFVSIPTDNPEDGPTGPPDEAPDTNTDVADRLYRRLLPLHDQAAVAPADDSLYDFVGAIAQDLQPLERVIREYDDLQPWARAGDVDTAPLWTLPWMASLVGVEWHGDPSPVLRQQIRALPRFRRGSTAAIVSAAQTTLTGGQDVRIVPRNGGDIWQLVVITKQGETPNPADTVRAINQQKPAGMILTHIISDVPIVDEANVAVTIDSVSASVTIDNVTFADVD